MTSINNQLSGSNPSQSKLMNSKFVKPDQMEAVMRALGDL